MMNYECLIRSLEATGGFCQLLGDLDDLVLFRISCHRPDARCLNSQVSQGCFAGSPWLAIFRSTTIGSGMWTVWHPAILVKLHGWTPDKIVGCQTLSWQAMKVPLPLTFFTARLRASDLHQMGSIVKVKCMSWCIILLKQRGNGQDEERVDILGIVMDMSIWCTHIMPVFL